MAQNVHHVLLHFIASDPLDVTKKCMAINHVNRKEYEYMQPIKDGSSWVVFFYADATNIELPPVTGGSDG